MIGGIFVSNINVDFQHLVLLVGTNTLPNYIAARYFIDVDNNDRLRKIWLVYSSGEDEMGTTNERDRIKEHLQEYIKNKKRKIEISDVSLSDVGKAEAIRTDVIEKLTKKIKRGESVHLNYTGGTKAMAVHVYHTINNKCNNTSFS